MRIGKVKRRLCAAFLVIIIAVTCIGSINVSAATDRAGVYTISGTYDIGDGSVSGYIEDFRIAVSTKNFRDDVSVTKFYNNKLFDWTYFSFYLHAGENVKEHTSFTLMRDGSRYNYKNLSGNTDLWLYQGELPDGDYELIYVGVYKSGLFSTKTYTFKYKFEVDTTPPSYTLKAGESTIASGSYTNKAIEYNVSDKQTTKIYYMSPSASSYSYISNTVKTISATAANNGLWKFYATDGFQSNSTVSVYLDTVSPVGKITNSSGTTLSSGSYTNKPVKYTATDTGGINFLQDLTPNASSWANYSSGTALSSTQGWYYFRAVDKAGNGSSYSTVYYDATAPTGTLYGGSSVKSSGSYTNASYIKYSATDAHSGVSSCYVKKPGSSSYVSYTNGSQLTAEGTYYFYCVDYSGNQSSIVSITLDRTIPTAELFVDGEAVPSGTYTNGEYISFESSGTCYVKLPNSTSFSDYVSGTEYDKPGKYVFYAKDAAGNNTGEYSIVIDRTEKSVNLDNVLGGKTDGDVTVYREDGDGDVYAPITSVTVNGKEISNGDILYTVSMGRYELFVTDAAGNTWSTSFVSTKKNILNDTLQKEYYETTDENGAVFSFDKSVDYSIDTYDNGIANSVTVNANEKVAVSVTKNGEPMEYRLGETITDVGKYRITLTDEYGNKAEISFEIIPPIVSTFTHNFDNVAGFEKVLKDGAEKRLNYGTLELLEDGTHELGIVVNGKTYPLTVKVDAIAPTIDLDGVENGGETKGKVILSNISEQAKVQVYLNDTEIEYQLGAALSDDGAYKVVITDDCGNVSEYNFEILPSLNIAVIVLIVIGIIAVVGVVVLVILKKKKLF